MLNLQGGNVGIGTATPGQKLSVSGNILANTYAYISSEYSGTDSVYGYNALGTGSGGNLKTGPVNASSVHPQAIVMGPTEGIRFITTSTWPGVSTDFAISTNEKMRINPSGNVGIGTTGPHSKIDATYTNFDATTYPGYKFYGYQSSNTAKVPLFHVQSGWENSTTANVFKVNTYQNEAGFNILANGSIGIGTTGPLSKLSVGGTGTSTSAIYGNYFVGVIGQGTSNGVIGNASDVSGYDFDAQGAGINYGSTSSIRWKKDLQPIDHALDKVLAMRGLYYTWDEAHGGQHDMGMIAEEVGQYVPEIVGWDPDAPGFATGMDYGHLTPVLVEAIKGLNTKLDNLSLTPDGQVNVEYNVSPEVLASLGYDGAKNEIENAIYSHQINTGLVKTINLVAQNIIAETTKSKEIKTAVISPLSDITDTIVVDGNLHVAGTLTATDATFTSVYADKIISPEGSFGQVMTDKIAALRQEIRDTISGIGTTAAESTPSALVAEAPTWTFNTGTSQTEVTGSMALSDNMVIGARLTVLGDTQLGNAFITGTFTAGEVAIKDNFIETTASVLHIQPSGLGAVHIMNNTLVIAENGEVTLTGNLAVTGNINTASLFANLINSTEITTNKLTAESINVSTSSATPIIAEAGFAQLATTSAQLSTNATAGTSTLPAGKTELVIYNQKITQNSIVYLTPVGSTNNQVVYLKSKTVSPTPTTPESTSSGSLITDHQSQFTIALDTPLTTDININWWIIN